MSVPLTGMSILLAYEEGMEVGGNLSSAERNALDKLREWREADERLAKATTPYFEQSSSISAATDAVLNRAAAAEYEARNALRAAADELTKES